MSADLFGERPAAKRGVYELLRAYNEAYQRHFHVAAPIVKGKDGVIAMRLLKRYEFEDLYNWLALFFVVKDSFVQQSGYTFAAFERCIGKLIAHAKRVRAAIIERQPVTAAQVDHMLAVRQQMAAEDADAAQERAAAYYRERPWLPRC